jgi:hypothetical protein
MKYHISNPNDPLRIAIKLKDEDEFHAAAIFLPYSIFPQENNKNSCIFVKDRLPIYHFRTY